MASLIHFKRVRRERSPRLSGEGPGMLAGLPRPLDLERMEARPVGDDVLVQAYVHAP